LSSLACNPFNLLVSKLSLFTDATRDTLDVRFTEISLPHDLDVMCVLLVVCNRGEYY